MDLIKRCPCWDGEYDELSIDYHDHKWCKPIHDDNEIFSWMCLEIFSCGLSWKLILKKEKAFRESMHDFDIDFVASLTDADIDSLSKNPLLIRHKGKFEACRKNAFAAKTIQKNYGSLNDYLWSFVGGKQIDHRLREIDKMPSKDDLSISLSKDLKKNGFIFLGPLITYSFFQAIGMINDHCLHCSFR